MPNIEEIIEFGRKVSNKEAPIIGIYKYRPEFFMLIEKLRVQGFLVVLYDDTESVKLSGYEITDKLESFKKRMDLIISRTLEDCLNVVQNKVYLVNE